jgi:hypothetical protein
MHSQRADAGREPLVLAVVLAGTFLAVLDAWLNYLQREALTYGDGRVPHESQRLPVTAAQVDEIRRRQRTGLIENGDP